MILKYVWKNFRRRRVRTVLMVLALLVSTGLIVSLSATVETVRRSNVEIIASGVGRYDLTVRRTEISPEPFVEVARSTETVRAADGRLTAVYPRFQPVVELAANGELGNGYLIALDAGRDDIGFIDVVSGTFRLGDNRAAVLEATASAYDLDIGDPIDVAYAYPLPREKGKAGATDISERRTSRRFTVAAVVRQDGVADAGVRDGLIVDLADAQAWLGLENQAELLVALVDPRLYEAQDAETAALEVREVATNVQAAMGEAYTIGLAKAAVLDGSAQAFLILQALINTYGLLALGVVGLLVHTLVMTNVQEQRREMAILRILGSQRRYLFAMVLVEVAVIGAIGISLGVVLGQFITRFAVVPLIAFQLEQAGLTPRIQPVVSLTAVLPAVLSAIVVLFASALRPAQDAARTKVMHAINPGVADNIQLEDIAALRERRPSLRLLLMGFVLLVVVSMALSLDIISSLGNPALEATLFFAILIMMVIGIGLVFFITTVPFERLIMWLVGFLAPRLTYFASRNVGRSQARNTLISLLVLFSGVLPSFLATQTAIENANLATDVKLNMGAPVEIRVFGGFGPGGENTPSYLQPDFVEEELAQIDGLDRIVGSSYAYRTRIGDAVDMRSGAVDVFGIDGRLTDVLFDDMIEFSGGSRAAFDEILRDENAAIISEGLAEGLQIPLGGMLRLTGQGLDHVVELRIAGIARRLPGFSNVGRGRTAGLDGSPILVSLDTFRRIANDPTLPPPPADAPIYSRFLATTRPGIDPQEVATDLGNRFSLKYSIFTRLYEVRLEQAAANRAQQQALLLVLTIISFTTAVFGVFAVIYVTIYARRLEIGMMKAIGTRRRELTGMLTVEAIAMTLSAALAGITAGASMAYIFSYIDSLSRDRPLILAVDTTVMPFVVIMVVLASMIGAFFSARRIVRRRAVEILRMQ